METELTFNCCGTPRVLGKTITMSFPLQVLCWGVRNMKRFQLASVSSPSIEFECGGHVIHSTVIKNTQKNPNFDQPLFFFDVVSLFCYYEVSQYSVVLLIELTGENTLFLILIIPEEYYLE